jgi:hypothetical protein
MFFYTGRGWVVLALFWVIVFVSILLNRNLSFYRSPWPEIVAMVINIIGCWFLGRWLNKGILNKILDYRMVDGWPTSAGHTFCFIRVEYGGWLSVFVYGLMLYLGSLIGGVFK